MSKVTTDEVKDFTGLIVHIIVSFLYMIYGIVMTLTGMIEMSNQVFVYTAFGIGILLIVIGAYLMGRFFLKDEYKRVSNYGFTLGIVMIAIGGLVILNSQSFPLYANLVLCIGALILSAIILQQSFSMKALSNSGWWVILILGALAVGSSILLLIDFNNFVTTASNVYFVTLSVIGCLSLICLLIITFSIKNFEAAVNKRITRNMEENPISNKEAKPEVIFEDETVADIAPENDDKPVENTLSDDSFEE